MLYHLHCGLTPYPSYLNVSVSARSSFQVRLSCQQSLPTWPLTSFRLIIELRSNVSRTLSSCEATLFGLPPYLACFAAHTAVYLSKMLSRKLSASLDIVSAMILLMVRLIKYNHKSKITKTHRIKSLFERTYMDKRLHIICTLFT